jgi:GYF domain 2
MAPGRFYYSADGTETKGPVTWGVLQQLYQDQAIGAGSFLCREGETEWQPLKPADFDAPVLQTIAAPRRIPTPPPFVPSDQYVQGRVGSEEFSGVDGTVNLLLSGVGGLAAIGAAAFGAAMSHPGASVTNVLSYKLGSFAGGLIFFALLPYVVSLVFKDLTRVVMRSVGMIVLSLLAVVGQLNLSTYHALATANTLNAKANDDAKKEIASKGYYSGDPQKAEQDLQQVRSQLTGDTEVARLSRDLLDVTHQILAKVKISDDAEKACVFEVNTIASADDITARRALLAKLKDTQMDVKTYLEGYDSHCRVAMASENAAPATVDAIIGGARKGGHIDLLVSLWQQKIKLTDDYVARLDFLSQKFGAWSTKNDKILFQDDAAVAGYNKLVGNLHDDVQQIEATQKQFFQ